MGLNKENCFSYFLVVEIILFVTDILEYFYRSPQKLDNNSELFVFYVAICLLLGIVSVVIIALSCICCDDKKAWLKYISYLWSILLLLDIPHFCAQQMTLLAGDESWTQFLRHNQNVQTD